MLLEVTGVRLTGTLSYIWVEWFVPVMSVLSGAGGCLFSSPQQKLTKQPVFLSWWHCNLLKWILLFQTQQAHPYHYVSSNLTWGTQQLLYLLFLLLGQWLTTSAAEGELCGAAPPCWSPIPPAHLCLYEHTHTWLCTHTVIWFLSHTGSWGPASDCTTLLYKYTAVLPVCFTQVSHSMMSKFWNVIDSKLIRTGCVWLLIDSLD